jgi:TRAP transporter TAXI family solute receptor
MYKKWLILLFFVFLSIGIIEINFINAQPLTPYKIEIYSLPLGYNVYNMGVALSEEINKNTKLLKAVHFEGKDPTVHMKMLIVEPERKKHSIFFTDSWATWAGEKQLGGLKGVKYDFSKFRGLFALSAGPNTLVTVNPKIKTLEDLKGKRVVLTSTPGGVVDLVLGGILKEAGIFDHLKIQYIKPKEAVDALKDGLIDAAMFGLSLRGLPNIWGPSPSLVELASTKDTYFIPISGKYIRAFAEKTGCSVGVVTIPPKMLGPLQTEPLEVINKHIFWGVHLEMPDDVVREVLNIVYNRANVFKEYDPLGKILSKETMARMGLKEEQIHPAALKFYKEKNISIGGFE